MQTSRPKPDYYLRVSVVRSVGYSYTTVKYEYAYVPV